MLVTVKTLTGQKVSFEVNEGMTFGNLKEEISIKQGIEIPQIRLIFGGHMVNDLQKITESTLKAGDILHMVLSLRGG